MYRNFIHLRLINVVVPVKYDIFTGVGGAHTIIRGQLLHRDVWPTCDAKICHLTHLCALCHFSN